EIRRPGDGADASRASRTRRRKLTRKNPAQWGTRVGSDRMYRHREPSGPARIGQPDDRRRDAVEFRAPLTSRPLRPVAAPRRCGPRAVVFAALAVLLSACTGIPGPQNFITDTPPKTADVRPAPGREHLRILAAYGGAYEDPVLLGVISQTVERLVAASER